MSKSNQKPLNLSTMPTDIEPTNPDQRNFDDRSTPMPRLQPSLSSPRWGLSNRGMQGGIGVNMQSPEVKARRMLAWKGYRIHAGSIWYIENDDPDNFQEFLVANWDGTPQDAYDNLERHNWPQTMFVVCPCGDGEADFGSSCRSCQTIEDAEIFGEMVSDMRRGK